MPSFLHFEMAVREVAAATAFKRIMSIVLSDGANYSGAQEVLHAYWDAVADVIGKGNEFKKTPGWETATANRNALLEYIIPMQRDVLEFHLLHLIRIISPDVWGQAGTKCRFIIDVGYSILVT